MDKWKIDKKAKEMILAATIELDKYRIREDYFGLFSDIAYELSTKAQGKEILIYNYADLLDEEQRIYSPFEAYEAGFWVGCNSTDDSDARYKAFSNYIKVLQLKNVDLIEKRKSLFKEIHILLGNTHGLLKDFNELYQKCNGIIGNNLKNFFDLGYKSASRSDISIYELPKEGSTMQLVYDLM